MSGRKVRHPYEVEKATPPIDPEDNTTAPYGKSRSQFIQAANKRKARSLDRASAPRLPTFRLLLADRSERVFRQRF